jgi:hypothetical protein
MEEGSITASIGHLDDHIDLNDGIVGSHGRCGHGGACAQ